MPGLVGSVMPAEADQLQRALHTAPASYLLLLEHPHVYARLERRPEHVLVRRKWAPTCARRRGGDVTYHGPGQLVGYPIVTLPGWRRGSAMSGLRAWLEGVPSTLSPTWGGGAPRTAVSWGVGGDRKIAPSA